MQLNGTVPGQVQPAVWTTNMHPPAETWHLKLLFHTSRGQLPPQASHLRSHAAAGSKGRMHGNQQRREAAVKSVPAAAGAFQLCIRLSHSPRNGSVWASRSSWRKALQQGRPSSPSLGKPQTERLCSRPLKLVPQFHSFLFYVNFSSACAEVGSHLEPNPM